MLCVYSVSVDAPEIEAEAVQADVASLEAQARASADTSGKILYQLRLPSLQAINLI